VTQASTRTSDNVISVESFANPERIGRISLHDGGEFPAVAFRMGLHLGDQELRIRHFHSVLDRYLAVP